MTVYWIHDVMPQPWEVQAQTQRGKNKWAKARLISPEQLREYKEDLEYEFRRKYPSATPTKDLLRVHFAFWRNTADGAKDVDATNLLKATEDILEGILYTNDVNNRHVSSDVVEQGPDVANLIRVDVRPYEPLVYDLPDKPASGPVPLIEILDEVQFDL